MRPAKKRREAPITGRAKGTMGKGKKPARVSGAQGKHLKQRSD